MISSTEKQDQLLDELLRESGGDAEAVVGKNGLVKQLTKRLVERALEAEMAEHLGYDVNERGKSKVANSRNGKSRKTVLSESGALDIEVPRDRDSSFEPQLVKKRQRRLEGLDEKVIAMYARGLSTREIQAQLEDLYGVEVSATLISNVTNAVMDELRAWQSRPLSSVYPVMYFDALHVKSRQDGAVKTRAVYVALGLNVDGEKELLGLWVSENEGSKFWLGVFTELRNRGVNDCFVACVDGLKGLPEAFESVFPQAQVQLCIVHKVRNALRYVPWKERKAVARDLRAVYAAATVTQAEQAMDAFSEHWDAKYPAITKSWRADWARLTVFFDFAPEIRKVIYTTNAIESLNYSLRRVLKKRGAFPTDESIVKVLYLALNNVAGKWTRPVKDWKAALNQFVILYADRLPV